MQTSQSVMVDLIFPLRGGTIPLDHGYLLYSAVSATLDGGKEGWLHTTDAIGLHPIRGRYAGQNRLQLSQHSVLGIRLPVALIPHGLPLAGKKLRLGDHDIQVGISLTRALIPASVLYTRIVTTRNGQDDARFDAEIRHQLAALKIRGKVTRGRRRWLTIKDKAIIGHAVLVTELTAEESIRLQEHGLGGRRKMGCGVFNPWRG